MDALTVSCTATQSFKLINIEIRCGDCSDSCMLYPPPKMLFFYSQGDSPSLHKSFMAWCCAAFLNEAHVCCERPCIVLEEELSL